MELDELIKEVKNTLSEKRFYHSQCVMERCAELAEKYNVDVEKMKKIGICHDIAKEMTVEEYFNYIEKNNIIIDNMERENPKLLHAKIGKSIVIDKFGFSEEMGQAIEAHTTGLPNMDIYAKILFIADRTSKERGFPDIELLNTILDRSLNEAVLYILDKKIVLQIEKKATMHINTIITRNWLLKEGI